VVSRTAGYRIPRERILRGGPLVVSLRLKALLLLLSIFAKDVCTLSSGRDGRLLPLDFLSSAAPAARNFRRAVLVLLYEDDCVCDSMRSVDVSAAKCWKIMCEYDGSL
jgi:hypothetical protein